MKHSFSTPRRRRGGLLAASLMLVAAGACADSEPAVGPLLPPTPPDNPEIVSAAWIADVNKITGTVNITPPARGYDPQILADFFGLAPDSPEMSILAGDVVDVLADNTTLNFSPVGQFLPGLIRITFDVAILNKLSRGGPDSAHLPHPASRFQRRAALPVRDGHPPPQRVA